MERDRAGKRRAEQKQERGSAQKRDTRHSMENSRDSIGLLLIHIPPPNVLYVYAE
jgi:hypothetical protein